MAGRSGDIRKVQALRRNIVAFAGNTAEAHKMWMAQSDIDVWLVCNIWHVLSPEIADLVTIEPEYVLYRDTAVAVTRRGSASPVSQQSVEFLKSDDGAAIFFRWGRRTGRDAH